MRGPDWARLIKACDDLLTIEAASLSIGHRPEIHDLTRMSLATGEAVRRVMACADACLAETSAEPSTSQNMPKDELEGKSYANVVDSTDREEPFS